LEAAEAIVVDEGAARLTIDAVAERSGVSKGGVLYHFPSKEALLEGMLAFHMERTDARREALYATIPAGPARQLRGEIQFLLGPRDPDEQVRAAAILAIIANQPDLMKSLRERQRKRFDDLASAPGSFERRALVLLAADGLFLMELLRASPFTAAERGALVDELLDQAERVAREN
jgi:AcrR family transcriptional regulator